jgi:quercetin dioxygenase-like cupin family protein
MKVQSIESHPAKDVNMEGASGVRMRMLIGADDGAKNFHMRLFEVQPGGHSPHHTHNYEHEVIILQGEATVKSEQGDRPAKEGDVVFVPPNEKHQFQNTGTGLLRFVCLIPAPEDCSQ